VNALLELAERCEAATGPDRELDEAILRACWSTGRTPTDLGPRFTASIDEAMKLVPKPAWVRMDEWPHDFCHGPVASIQPIREPAVAAHVATGPTLALALCAAALRAIASQETTR
jgi:hypothetical protein